MAGDRKAAPAWAIAALKLACAAPLTAQGGAETSGPVEGEPAIIVTGRSDEPPTQSEVYAQALAVSRLDSHALYDLPAPSFGAPLCPGVFGLKRQAAEMVVDRIRANAARLKVRLAREQCSPNLLVAVFDDGRQLLGDLQRHQPRLFRLVDAQEREELLSGEAPVRVWNNIRTIGPYGPVPIRRDREELPSLGSKVVMYLPMTKNIQSALVVFEREAVIGLTLQQLADYATMRGLSHTRPAQGAERMETILALFANDGDSPAGLTSFDLGYLGSLYFDRPNGRAVSRLLGVRQRAEQSAAAAPAGN
jgi:hypothetical protein